MPENNDTVTYVSTAVYLGHLVARKQQAYGDSVGKAPEILRSMYPNGIRPEQYRDLMMITRVLDKLFRIANQKHAFGEDPWKDIFGYALLSVVNDQSKGDRNGKSKHGRSGSVGCGKKSGR